MKKKLWVLILTVLMCLVMAVAVSAEGEEDYYTYIILGGKATITDVDTSISGSVTVPSELEGYPVTAIGNNAFQSCTSITDLTIPEGIAKIGNYAFKGCSKMTEISLPEGITSIGSYAFDGCTVLKEISIPTSVISIGSYAFSNCDTLVSVVIPEGVTSVGSDAFSYCNSLTSVVIPKGITAVTSNIFYECPKLTKISLPNSVTSIGSYAFYKCTSLKSITLPNSVTSIGNRSFYGCKNLMGVAIPDSVASIGAYAFHYTTSYSTSIYRLPNLTIYGYTGSYAQTYAKEESIPFYSLGDIAEPAFVTDLTDATYSVGETVTLSVLAEAGSAGTLTYQWYVSDTADGDGTAIDGATDSSYLLPTENISEKYYYVIAINTNGTNNASVKSNVAKIIVVEAPTASAEVPVIFAQTSSSACRSGEDSLLFVSASVTDGGTLSYQWYVSDTANNEGTPIDGAVSAGYKPSTETEGTLYYYVVITNTVGESTSSVKSDVMALTVGSGYITGDVNKSGQTDAEDSRILAQYFAGHNVENEFTNPDAADINSDGEFARNDASVLARYISGWTEYNVRINYPVSE